MFLTEPKRKPRLLMIAGPDGSGKSMVTKGLPLIGLYINADEIKRVSGCSDLEAAQEAEQLRELLLARGADFTFEAVLSTDRNLSLPRRAAMTSRRTKSRAAMKNRSAISLRWSG
ncbi:MAG: hypothetical protein IJV64_11180 [Oscillospiraceae bacterium]|nr:hypothetical protein [Oscillospiraceae bacterium]